MRRPGFKTFLTKCTACPGFSPRHRLLAQFFRLLSSTARSFFLLFGTGNTPAQRLSPLGPLGTSCRSTPRIILAFTFRRKYFRHSSGAALVCMLLPPPPADGGAAYVELLHTLTDGLPPTVLCKSGGDPVMTFEI